MTVYVDTSVLVAAFVRIHPHYGPASDLVAAVKRRSIKASISTHALAEFYSVLTRTPFQPRIHPADAGRIIDDDVLSCFGLIPLSAADYKAAVRHCAMRGLAGGVVFDALHLFAAQKAKCSRIYTFNVKDFRALAAGEFGDKITAP